MSNNYSSETIDQVSTISHYEYPNLYLNNEDFAIDTANNDQKPMRTRLMSSFH